MTDAAKLEPCPLCGGEKVGLAYGIAGCQDCALFINRETNDEAVLVWNRRASDVQWAAVEEIEKEMRGKDEQYVGATFLGLSEWADRLAAARKGAKE